MEQTNRMALFIFRMVAVAAVVAGAIITVKLVLQAGGNNKSILLVFLFIVWDFSPFAALLAVNAISKHWRAALRIALYTGMLVIAGGSAGYYSTIYELPGPAHTAPFLIVPLLSWLLLFIIIPIASAFAKRSGNKDDL